MKSITASQKSNCILGCCTQATLSIIEEFWYILGIVVFFSEKPSSLFLVFCLQSQFMQNAIKYFEEFHTNCEFDRPKLIQ